MWRSSRICAFKTSRQFLCLPKLPEASWCASLAEAPSGTRYACLLYTCEFLREPVRQTAAELHYMQIAYFLVTSSYRESCDCPDIRYTFSGNSFWWYPLACDRRVVGGPPLATWTGHERNARREYETHSLLTHRNTKYRKKSILAESTYVQRFNCCWSSVFEHVFSVLQLVRRMSEEAPKVLANFQLELTTLECRKN